AEVVRLGAREFWSGGGTVIDFIESHCRFTNGRWTGDPFVLQSWQKRMLYELFEIDPVTGLRRYRRALIGIPRKSGKTELAAALAIYFFAADGERSAEVYCAAASEDQADRVFEAAKRMVEKSPTLSQVIDVAVGRLSAREDPYSYLQRLTSTGKTKHGLNIHAVVLDEVHAWGVGEAEELWAALTTGMAAREQPMMLMITTAGSDLEMSRCGGLYQYGRSLERGDLQDDGFFFRWWQAPDGSDHGDPAMWKVSNPSFGVTVNEQFLRGELAGTNVADGKRKGAITEGEFRRLYLNQWINFAETPWVTQEQIAACRVPPFTLSPNEPTWAGIDLSETRDATAVAHGQWWAGDERPCGHHEAPCLYLRVRAWERPRGGDGRDLPEWQVPQAEVKQYLRDQAAEYDVLTNVFDPWHSKLLRQDLEADGLKCEEIWQTGARRSGASAALYDLILQKRLHYCDDVFERHVLNAKTKATGTDGGYYLAKRRAGRTMDAAMAAVNVVYGTIFEPATNAWHGIYIPGDDAE
ncbi:MAG: terminase large subunit domain-containing protein, partial [Chloroflexota bacterium]